MSGKYEYMYRQHKIDLFIDNGGKHAHPKFTNAKLKGKEVLIDGKHMIAVEEVDRALAKYISNPEYGLMGHDRLYDRISCEAIRIM